MIYNSKSYLYLTEIVLVSLLLFTSDSHAQNIGYDAAGRVIWTIQPSGQTTTFGYDANGNIESIASMTPAEDSDADGLPDYFEIRFTGTKTALTPTDDADQDGMNHLFEFAFTKDPFISDATEITLISLEVPNTQTGDQFFTLKYLRPQSGTQHLKYVTEISYDLTQPWIAEPAILSEAIVPMEGGVEEVTVRVTEPIGAADTFFMRIAIQKL